MIGWLDCSAGVSGDMLLAALVDAGAPVGELQRAVDALGVEPVTLRAEPVLRAGLGALRVHVETSAEPASRSWTQVRELLGRGALAPRVRELALDVFGRLAVAEGEVHRIPPEDVHFHEVGALDALADVVGACAGLVALGEPRLTVSPVAVGSGATHGAHGPLPVPVPAVLVLLRGAPVVTGAVAHESTTPTGAALVATFGAGFGPLPPMTVDRVGTGAGGRDPAEVANIVRLVLGQPSEAGAEPRAEQLREADLLLAANVDDLDPRLWPGVLARLLADGASDAWLTPILMKKGRPAHTLSVLCPTSAADRLRQAVFRETSTIGLRETQVAKTTLDRFEELVEVYGRPVRVKRAMLDGRVVNSSPEWADVAAVAAALGVPAKQVLAAAISAAGPAVAIAQTPSRKLSDPAAPWIGTDTTS